MHSPILSIKSIVILVCLSQFIRGQSLSLPGKFEGQSVPEFSAKTIDSVLIDSSFFRSRVSVITFYLWSCLPCRHEVKQLAKLAMEFDPGTFAVIVITDDSKVSIKKHFSFEGPDESNPKKIGIDPQRIKFIADPSHRLFKIFRVEPKPETFIIDKQGQVAVSFLGFATEKKHENSLSLFLREKIGSLLKE